MILFENDYRRTREQNKGCDTVKDNDASGMCHMTKLNFIPTTNSDDLKIVSEYLKIIRYGLPYIPNNSTNTHLRSASRFLSTQHGRLSAASHIVHHCLEVNVAELCGIVYIYTI